MTFHWTDTEREELETRAAGDKRELMVHIFYPGDASAPGMRAPYLPDADLLRRDWNETQISTMETMRSYSRENAPLPSDKTRYPVAIFLPGRGTKVLMYQALIEDLASHGWVVAAIDQTYNAPVRFPDGRVLGNLFPAEDGWPDAKTNTNSYNARILHRARDVGFVIDELTALDNGNGPFARRLDLKRGVGVFGHSLGGTTAGTVRLLDKRVASSVNLDGVGGNGAFILAKGPRAGGLQPIMWILARSVEHETWHPYRALALVSGGGLRIYLNRPGFTHRDFSDEPFWNVSMSPDERSAKLQAIAEIREWVRTFFESTVRGDRVGLERFIHRPGTVTPNTVRVLGPLLRPQIR